MDIEEDQIIELLKNFKDINEMCVQDENELKLLMVYRSISDQHKKRSKFMQGLHYFRVGSKYVVYIGLSIVLLLSTLALI